MVGKDSSPSSGRRAVGKEKKNLCYVNLSPLLLASRSWQHLHHRRQYERSSLVFLLLRAPFIFTPFLNAMKFVFSLLSVVLVAFVSRLFFCEWRAAVLIVVVVSLELRCPPRYFKFSEWHCMRDCCSVRRTSGDCKANKEREFSSLFPVSSLLFQLQEKKKKKRRRRRWERKGNAKLGDRLSVSGGKCHWHTHTHTHSHSR